MTPDPEYVAARRVLLDALELLSDHVDSIVVAGAQAVYLRTGDINIGVAAFTTDGDLAIDPGRLADAPSLPDLMSQTFVPWKAPSGAAEPGIWVTTARVGGREIEVKIDLIVPEGIAPPGGSRGARLWPHGRRAARKASGLEAVVIDHDRMTISALNPSDDGTIDCRVAGPTALLIAKAHKIHDRFASRHVKTAARTRTAATCRLMQTTSIDDVRAVLRRLVVDDRAAEASRRAGSVDRSVRHAALPE